MSKKRSSQSASGDDPAPAGGGQAPYMVLARKYRPATFEDLIGQDPMVRTLRNAFRMGRIAQAYMLTGVRGVGKTTTARIIARALNYARPGEGTGPTIDLAEPGEHCQAIMESRHVDVVEMDAASHTGIDDIREIIEAVRYKPAYARYKVFIIDEVHMLSKAAFNGLLKTLEEPPPHVKFIFATTEIRKVPVTVLSRCQRFDLRRVPIELLIDHFTAIAAREGQTIDRDAVALIARAAEGSVRDGLSLLDQAFAHGQGAVTPEQVRAMLGLADRVRIFDLLEAVFKGDVRDAVARLGALYADGADPAQLLIDLAAAVHAMTRIKAAGAVGAELSEAERQRAGILAAGLSMAALTRAWQMLLKGLDELARAPRAIAAAEMVLIRMGYAADLPPPDEIIRRLGAAGDSRTNRERSQNEAPTSAAPEASAAVEPPPARRTADGDAVTTAEPVAPASSAPQPASFAEVAALAGERRDVRLKLALEEYAELVRFRPGHIELHLLEGAPKDLANDLGRKLKHWTGARWIISISETRGETPLGIQRRDSEARALEDVRRHPAVQAVFRHFPGAEITGVRDLGGDGDERS